jgi:hypothetical protein
MEFETLVKSRKSVRGYKPDPVPRIAKVLCSLMLYGSMRVYQMTKTS